MQQTTCPTIFLGGHVFWDGKWVYPTKEEAAYPLLLCTKIASLVLKEAIARNLGPDDDESQQLQHDKKGRAATAVYKPTVATKSALKCF